MDSDEETGEYQSWKGVPATIVLINAYNPSKSETPALSQVATCRVLRQHLRLTSNHYIGVCFYGTDSDASNFGLQNVSEICPLDLPNLDNYKKLQSTNIESYGQAKELKLSDVLWHCSKMFTNCKKMVLSRTLLILTSLDLAPVESDHRPTYTRVANLVESNIGIQLINISKEDVTVDPFYKNFLSEVNEGKEVPLPKRVWDCHEIEKCMLQQSHRHLAIAQLSFEIGNGFAIGVGVYSLLKTTNEPKNSNLHRDTNAILTSVTKTSKILREDVTSDTVDIHEGDSEEKHLPLLKSELLHYQEYGGQRIEFTDKEKKHISNPFGPPILKLLGFKPAQLLCKEKWFLKPGYFLFPNEGVVDGSTVAFKALYKACQDTSSIPICVLCTRVNSKPYLVALSPCSNPLGLDVDIGFDVIRIPFMESVRQLPVEEDEDTPNISEPHRIAMHHIINNLKFDYKPDMFENPKIQSLYRAVEAIALADDEVDCFTDTTKPNVEKFQGLHEDLFEELFGPFGAVSIKRPSTNKASTGNNKKPKLDFELDEDLLQCRIRDGKVSSYTVAQLKQILESKNIPDLPAMTGLKKNQLVDLVNQYC